MDEIGETVITVDGTTVLKTLCRSIRGVFYKIGDINIENSGQCYCINDKFYKYDTGYIIYNHTVKQYVIKKVNNIVEGVIDIVDNVPVMGTFTKDEYQDNIIINYKGNKYYVLNDNTLKGSKFIEDLSSGEYYHRSVLECIRFIEPVNVSDNYKRDLPYDSRGITSEKMKVYDKLYEPVYNKTVEKYGGITKDLSFGLEFETSIGTVPKRICNKLGLIPLRDGSINGLEYVTIPLSGKKGIQTIVDSVQELKKRTRYDNDCSLHIHIGNIPRTEEFFLALFKVINAIQEPFFALFPLHKKYNYGIKRKHYTKPFNFMEILGQMDPIINDKNIKNNFSILYDFLSMGHSYADRGSDLNNVAYHPSDPHGTSKWNIRSR